MPRPKTSPGEAVLTTVGTTPESSVAVGAVHVTETPVELTGMATLMSFGQPEITGAVESIVATKTWDRKNIWIDTHFSDKSNKTSRQTIRSITFTDSERQVQTFFPSRNQTKINRTK